MVELVFYSMIIYYLLVWTVLRPDLCVTYVTVTYVTYVTYVTVGTPYVFSKVLVQCFPNFLYYLSDHQRDKLLW